MIQMVQMIQILVIKENKYNYNEVIHSILNPVIGPLTQANRNLIVNEEVPVSPGKCDIE